MTHVTSSSALPFRADCKASRPRRELPVNAFYFYSHTTANSTVDGGLVSAPGNRSSIGTARGLGTTFPGSVRDGNTITGTAIGADGRPRRSFGYIGQVTYRIPTSRLTIGGSYGASRLDANPGDTSTLVERNDSYVGLVEYRAAEALRFVGEFTHSEAHNHMPLVPDDSKARRRFGGGLVQAPDRLVSGPGREVLRIQGEEAGGR